MLGVLDGSVAPWYVWQMAAKAALSSSSAQTSVGKSKASSMPASLLNFVHVQVVECKVAVALVAVGHIGGYHIGVSRAQGHHLAGQMNLCLALGDQKQTGEGRRHSLPVPVGMVAGKPYMEHYQAQRFYRYIHGRWVSDYATKVGIFL